MRVDEQILDNSSVNNGKCIINFLTAKIKTIRIPVKKLANVAKLVELEAEIILRGNNFCA